MSIVTKTVKNLKATTAKKAPASRQVKATTRKATTAKAASTKKTATTAPAKKATKKATETRGMSATKAAHQVLKRDLIEMNCRDLIDRMSLDGLWTSPGGATPEATLYAAIIREMKGTDSRFARGKEKGTFRAA
ncbi:MAG: hypothetical protein HC841_00495 [Verrucomicrobiae bacterium]|nr:hypothetical protein [Verrucomicrobiae bacterium]